MADDRKGKEEEEKSFIVRDRRFSAQKGDGAEAQDKEEGRGEAHPKGEEAEQSIPLPEIDFTNFLFSLSTSVLIHLGEIQDPITQASAKNLPLAKQTIDLIGMLKEKTKGNLTQQEEKIFESILYDLRMRYIKATG